MGFRWRDLHKAYDVKLYNRLVDLQTTGMESARERLSAAVDVAWCYEKSIAALIKHYENNGMREAVEDKLGVKGECEMCVSVMFENGYSCDYVDELCEMIPASCLVVKEHYGDIAIAGCLCQIDIEKTLEKAGYEYELLNCGDYLARKKTVKDVIVNFKNILMPEIKKKITETAAFKMVIKDTEITAERMTLKDIVAEYLKKNNFDGLFNSHVGCNCVLDELMPCNSDCKGCSPGVVIPCGHECEEPAPCLGCIGAECPEGLRHV